MAKSICKGCNEKFPTEDMVIIKKKKYCKDCSTHQNIGAIKALTFACSSCKNEFAISEKVQLKGKSYCPQCHEKARREIETYNKLKDFIWERQGENQGKLVLAMTQIKRYVEEYGYTYNGIYLTLNYFIKYKNGSIKDGIGIVPYCYDEAKEFYRERHNIIKETRENTNPWLTKEVVKVGKLPEHKPKLKILTMNMEDLEV